MLEVSYLKRAFLA